MIINHLLFVLGAFLVILSAGPKLASGSSVGVCHGIQRASMPTPAQVVALYQSNQIGRMRLEEPDHEMFNALRGTKIRVVVGVRKTDMEKLAISSDRAIDWVAQNIRAYWPDVHFRYIVVGYEAIPGNLAQFVLPAMKNLQKALTPGGLWDKIKVTTIVSPTVMGESFPPSAANFSDSAVVYMKPIAQYLVGIGTLLLANVYPYMNYIQDPNHTALKYALFLADKDVFVDSGRGYRNSFDSIVDAFYTSLEKVGTFKLRIAVSETGWPSAGDNKAASVSFASTYNSNVIKHALSSQGTPKRPGAPIETYLFSMFNEERKFGKSTVDNFGLFNPDMTPVYPVDFNATL